MKAHFSDGDEDMDEARERLIAYLDSIPFPWPKDAEIERIAKRLARDGQALSLAGAKVKVQVLSSFLTDYLVDHLILMFARRGLVAEIRRGDYGIMAAAILDEGHSLHVDPPDLFLILPSFRDLAYCPPLGASLNDAQQAVEQEVNFWRSLWAKLPAPAVQLTFDTPPLRPLGEIDGFTPGGVTYHARQVNLALAAHLTASLTLVDAEHLAQIVGQHNWHDAHVYHLCKQPTSFAALPHIADALSAAAAGLLGKGRKVLVLDLDNTLWGGVIGDDGFETLELGPETAEGEAFTAFQHYLLQLQRRGIVLAVCSKNQEEAARLPFQRHPSMILKEMDVACFIANFEDKPANIRRIAEELNIGLEAFVFVDDNPVERALMRRELPQVLTVEMPENPAQYAETLAACRAFPLARLTDSDLQRATSYASRAATQQAMSAASDMDGFLASLEAQVIVEPVGPASVDRIVQLLAKTNQFKLNPTSFTNEALAARPNDVLALRLVDRLQDYGIVAVAVLAPNVDSSGALNVENWVMSCRVFARRLEFVMFEEILHRARQVRAKTVRLKYIPSDRNGLIADLLLKLGFVALDQHGTFGAPVSQEGETHMPFHHMEIVRLS